MSLPSGARTTSRVAVVFLVVLWTLLAANWLCAIARFQPNVMFMDQWYLYEALIRGDGWWRLFTLQLGPHRQGAAFVVTSWILEATQWDERWNSVWIASLLAMAALLALALKRRLTGHLQIRDGWMLLLGLSLGQFESVLTVPNASHSAFALVLIFLLARLWLAENAALRYVGAAACAALLTFSGFGLFAAVIASVLLLVATVRHVGARQATTALLAGAGLVLAAVAWIVFAQDYVWDTGGGTPTELAWSSVADFAGFFLLMLVQPAGVVGVSAYKLGLALAVAVIVVAATIVTLRNRLRREAAAREWEVLLLLLGSGLLFVGATAVGRMSFGIGAASSSRYLTLLFPIWFAVYLVAALSGRRRVFLGTTIFLWGFVAWPYLWVIGRPFSEWTGTLGLKENRLRDLQAYATNKAEWADHGLKTGDWNSALAAVTIPISPDGGTASLPEKLRYLREHGLSFFASRADRADFLPWWLRERIVWNDHFPFDERPHRLDRAVHLTFITREAGSAGIEITSPDGQPIRDLDVLIRQDDQQSVVRLPHLPGRVTFPVVPGFNHVTISVRAAADSVRSPPNIMLGPARRSETSRPVRPR